MKRTSINILCLIIIAILTSNVISLTWTGVEGLLDGYDAAGSAVEESWLPMTARLIRPQGMPVENPDTMMLDSGRAYPVIFRDVTLLVPDRYFSTGYMASQLIYMTVSIVLFVTLTVQFLKFIININKGRIFERVNLRHLRLFGICLLALAVMQCLIGIYDDYILSSLGMDSDGIVVRGVWSMPWSTMLIGCLALLMERIWSVALRMREEQELTI